MGTLAGSIHFSSKVSSKSGQRAVSIPIIAALVMLIGSSVLLFARLGYYSLWTDEASTAITAVGVWRTGDTSAWLDDHNLLTYRDGLLLKQQKDRYTSPLQFYLVAPFVGLLGHSSFACRLPFAICGMGTVLVIVCWLRRLQPPDVVWIAAAIILLGNASFFLFQRQCRYYALATFLTTLVAYLYCHWDGSRWRLLGIAAVMSLLLTSQYLDYAAVVECLVIDHGIWGRRRRAIRGVDWLVLIVPQLVTAVIVCRIWNPIERAASVVGGAGTAAHQAVAMQSHAWIYGLLKLFWWNLRDLIACDFVILPLLVLCPLLYLLQKKDWLLRAPMALLMFVAGIALFTAHPMPAVGNAEVRYLAPLLPLCIGIGILAVSGITYVAATPASPFSERKKGGDAGVAATNTKWLGASVVLLLSFATQSSALKYYRELWHPAVEPYTPVAQWVRQNIPAHSTVYVCPDWCVSPMMWNAPQATYVWQLSDPPKPDYANLADIYMKGRIPPDYLIAFGPYVSEIDQWRAFFQQKGVRYKPAATIPVYYKEMFRPELIWRSFKTIEPAMGEQISIFRRVQ